MPDNKYNENKIKCTTKLRNEIKMMEIGEKKLVAQLLFIAQDHGFGSKLVNDFIIPFQDFNTIRVGYRDNRPYEIEKIGQ